MGKLQLSHIKDTKSKDAHSREKKRERNTANGNAPGHTGNIFKTKQAQSQAHQTGEIGGRFNVLIETENPFKVRSRANTQQINSNGDFSNIENTIVRNETHDMSSNVQKRNDSTHNTDDNSFRRKNTIRPQGQGTQSQIKRRNTNNQEQTPVQKVDVCDTELFPTLQSQPTTTQAVKENCWKKSGVEIIKNIKKPQYVKPNTDNIRPGWISISREGIVNGPHSDNYENVLETHKRTQALFFKDVRRRNRRIVMDNLDLYGDEYYFVFGDPEPQLHDDGNTSEIDDDEEATSGAEEVDNDSEQES
jgi:hypothetical protein